MEYDDFAITFYFKDILPDLDSFKEFLETYTNVDKTDSFNPYCYKYLFNMFANSNVKYDTEDAFCRHFGITYENVFSQFKKRQSLVKKMYDITDDDLVMSRFVLANNSLNDNEVVGDNVDPLGEPLKYISAQTSSKERLNKLEAFDNALFKITDNLLVEFLDEFRKHFISIFTSNVYTY